MEVILLEDVKSLGKKGEKVSVSDGYARNFILAKKLGVEATAGNLNILKQQKIREEKEAQRILEEAKALAAKIEGKKVVVSAKTGEGGRIFGAVSTKEIVQAAEKQLGLAIDKKKLQLDEPIKNLGTVMVPLKLHKDVTAQLTVNVVEA